VLEDGGVPAEAPTVNVDPRIEVHLDGRSIDCTRVTVHAVTAAPRLSVVFEAMAAPTARLGESAVELETVATGRSRATLAVPADRAQRLEISGDRGSCVTYLRHAPTERAALEVLGAMSEREVLVARSEDTGAVSELSLDLSMPGDDVEARGAYFLEAYGAVLGVDRAQLRLVDRRRATDGWEELEYVQEVGGIRVFRAFLTLVFDERMALRSVRSTLVPGIVAAPAFVAREEDVLEAVEPVLGALSSDALERVLYDAIDVRRDGAPGGRAGYWAEGDFGAVLVDDATLEHVLTQSGFSAATHVELHHAVTVNPAHATVHCEAWGLICTLNIMSMSPFMEGSSRDAAPTVNDPSIAYPLAPSLWRQIGQAANYAETHLGIQGWAAFATPPRHTRWLPPLAGGRVRAIVDPLWGDNAAYSAGHRLLFFDDTSFVQDPDVICHEYGHAVEAEVGPANGRGATARQFASRSLGELVGDLFAIYCERAIDSARDPWVIADIGVTGPVRVIRDARDGRFSGGYRHFDEYRGSGDEDLYRPTYLVTRALYLAVSTYGMPIERAEALAVQTPGWNDVSSYPEFRDRWLSTARTWAETGRFGLTQDDVCAMARGLRDTGLDGEYGPTTGGGMGPDPGAMHTTATELVCTEERCPLCEMRPEPTREPLCAPEQLRGPTCTNAYGERICLDAVSDTSQECPEVDGVQTVRSCICLPGYGPRSPPRWGFCSRSCRTPDERALPPGELPPPSMGGGTGGANTCAVRPGPSSMLPALVIALAWIVRRRRRAGR
jgi:hypothetical protein